MFSFACTLLVLVGLCLGQDSQAYSPAQYNPYQFPQQSQDQSLGAGQVQATGEWYKVDTSYQPTSPSAWESGVQENLGFGFELGQIVRMTVGAILLFTTIGFVLKQLGVVDAISGSPAVKEAIKVLDESLPREARTLEGLMPIAQMVFQAIDKYAELEQSS